MKGSFAVRYGSLSSWNFWNIFWLMLIRFVLAMTVDPTRTDNYSPLWFVAWLISTAVMSGFIAAVMGLGLYRRMKRRPAPLANLLTMALAGVLGNVTIALLALNWGIDHEQIWTVRIVSAVVLHLGIFMGVNGLRATIIERNERIRELVATERQLQGYRDSAKQIVADEYEKLKRQSMDVLIPHIDRIEQLIATNLEQNRRDILIGELSSLISTEVRPLSKSIANEADKLAEIGSAEPLVRERFARWRAKFVLREAIAPLAIGGPMIVVFGSMEFLEVGHNSALRGYMGGLSVIIVLAIFKALLSKTRKIQTGLGIAAMIAISAISCMPSGYFMWFEYGFDGIWPWTLLMQFGAVTSSMFLIGYIRSSDLAARRFESALVQANNELAKEVALFEQKLALNRRHWSRNIHGNVQSALSAAVARLNRSVELEPFEFEQVRQDLARARKSLLETELAPASFDLVMAELVGAWSAVCTIKLSVSTRAKRALDINQDARDCVNEICKEAISNAVRHGDAKHALITIDRHEDDLLDLAVTNDGTPRPAAVVSGLGSKMLDELTLSWSLASDAGKTILSARIPLQKR